MIYEIVEVHIVFEQKGPVVFTVWKDGDWFRGTWMPIPESKMHEEKVYQRVSGYGTYLTPSQKKKYFPHIKKWSR